MTTETKLKSRQVLLLGLIVACFAVSGCASSNIAKGPFARTTIDIGIVAGNVEKSVLFYKALGFIEQPGFKLPDQKAGDLGLSDYHGFEVKVLVPSQEITATKIKIIGFDQVPSKKIANEFIHSSLGYRFLTMFVTDMTGTLKRAKQAGAVLVKNEPYQLGKANKYLMVIKDPDGNIIELIGPKR